MLGGGNFTSQNKVLPGTYINFISSTGASVNLSDRGVVAMPLNLDWGPDGEVFEINASDLIKNSMKLLGYEYDSNKLKGIRDIFKNARKLYAYRLNSGVKATVQLSAGEANGITVTAKYSGTRGNDIKIVVENSTENTGNFVISTYIAKELGGSVYTLVDKQDVANVSDLIGNDFVTFASTGTLAVNAGTSLAGGTNASEATGTIYQNALDKFEAYSFNALGCTSTNETIKALFVAYTKRMRDEVGSKFQCVLYNYAADYEGIVNVKNAVTDSETGDLVYWVTGVIAGCAVNKSNTNKTYDGEFTVNVDYTQAELEDAIKSGFFILHSVNGKINVLKDINSFVTTSQEKNESFSLNQVIRVLDQVANDIAVIFSTKYIGKIQNNQSGRISLWNDIVTFNRKLETMEAIEDFSAEDVSVEIGDNKTSVVVSNTIKPVCAMEQIYMTVVVD